MSANWANVSWYTFLPALFAIFLLLIIASDTYLSTMVESIRMFNEKGVDIGPLSSETQKLICAVAIDWNTRVTFVSTMIIAWFTCLLFGFYNLGLALGTFAILVVLFVFGLVWILSHSIGTLNSQSRFFGWRDATICNVALVVVYVLLSVELLLTQIY